MFLKTNRANAAAILGIPQTPLELESVRPEHLLMRTFARALIMWDSVDGSPGWFEAQLPPFILETHGMGMELNSEVAYFNIIAGACLGLAFRFAGSANESIHNILSANFSMLAKAAAGQSMSYEGKIRRNAARQALNIVSLASAIEMAGTGELGLTRRLRMSHGQEGASINYGSHMAMHMALGILYLGRGYYTIGNSNLAIAALAIACFPRFLPAMGDNKAYPQALRHLWVMSAEPRCLIARDVDTCESLFLPVKLFSKDVAQGANLISPTLIAPMNTLKSIVVDSPRYLPVTFDFANARDWSTLVQTRTIWVKRRAGYIDYAADPRGYRSLMVRAGTMSGFDLHYDLVSPAAPITVPPSDVVELVTTHSTNPVCVAIAHHFSGDTWLEKFARNVLFECLSIDKIIVLGTYLSMALGLQADDELLLERISQAAFAHHFYSAHVWDKSFALTGGSKRHPVLRQTFLAALMRNLGAPADGADPPSRRGYFAGVAPLGDTALSAYLVRNLVPPVRVLELLRARVAEAGAEADAEALAFRCRIVAERYMAAVGKQYGEGGEVGLWKRESIADALAVWRGEA
jgi:anaphase-promoting complex subunit 1